MDAVKDSEHEISASYSSYIIGFVLSLSITIMAFLIVQDRLFGTGGMVVAVVALAVVQLWVQLIFFFHMGRESKPRWNLNVFMFTLFVLFILVAGSLWIMYNLRYNMAVPSTDVNKYLQSQDGL